MRDKKIDKIFVFLSRYVLGIVVLVFLIIDFFQVYLQLPLQLIIITSNLEIIFLLYISYKLLFKGFVIALVLNIINCINLYFLYNLLNELIYFHMASFRFVSIALSGLVYLLSKRQTKYIEKLKQNSSLDSLTEIFNHRYFQDRLEIEFIRAKRMKLELGIIMMDIDNFKRYNDTYGHKSGDVILFETAQIIKQAARPQDVVCRYGADEFVIILPYLNKDSIDKAAEDIHKAYKDYIDKREDAKELSISISLGYSSYPNIASTKDELLSQADTALYHAKQQGINSVKIYKDVFHDIKQILNETESQLFATLKTLVGTISAKDRYTLGHSQRVMDYCVKIGHACNYTEENLKVLKISAILHDIGKIEIPQSILNKKEKLTNDEFELIKKHPVFSAEMIHPLTNFNNLYSTVLYHHERYDGKGYPDGISGEKIPFDSRILAIADSFDAMTSERPYKMIMSIDDAKQELRRCSGTQFDENIVNIFLGVLEKESLIYGEV